MVNALDPKKLEVPDTGSPIGGGRDPQVIARIHKTGVADHKLERMLSAESLIVTDSAKVEADPAVFSTNQ